MPVWMTTDYLTPIEWWLPLEKVSVLLSFHVFVGFLGVVALMFRWCQRPAPSANEQDGRRRLVGRRHPLSLVTRGLVNFLPILPLLPVHQPVRCRVPVERRVVGG